MNFWTYLSENTTYVVIVVLAIVMVIAAAFLIRPAGKLLDIIIGKFNSKKQNPENNPTDKKCINKSENTENNENIKDNDFTDNKDNLVDTQKITDKDEANSDKHLPHDSEEKQ